MQVQDIKRKKSVVNRYALVVSIKRKKKYLKKIK